MKPNADDKKSRRFWSKRKIWAAFIVAALMLMGEIALAFWCGSRLKGVYGDYREINWIQTWRECNGADSTHGAMAVRLAYCKYMLIKGVLGQARFGASLDQLARFTSWSHRIVISPLLFLTFVLPVRALADTMSWIENFCKNFGKKLFRGKNCRFSAGCALIQRLHE